MSGHDRVVPDSGQGRGGSPRDSSYYMEKLDELHSLCYAGLGHKELVDRVYHITWGALYGTPYERG